MNCANVSTLRSRVLRSPTTIHLGPGAVGPHHLRALH